MIGIEAANLRIEPLTRNESFKPAIKVRQRFIKRTS